MSEAIARLYCQDEVQPKHVKEAFRLLNKSIIRVETPDIQFDEDEEDQDEDMETEEDGSSTQARGAVNGMVNGHDNAGHDNADEQQAQRPKLRLVFDEYKRLSNLIIGHMHTMENKLGEDEVGLRRSDVVNWYLKLIEDEIETEEELAEKKFLIDKVLDRLINTDRVILALKDWGVPTEDYEPADEEENPFLVVHPNYEIQ